MRDGVGETVTLNGNKIDSGRSMIKSGKYFVPSGSTESPSSAGSIIEDPPQAATIMNRTPISLHYLFAPTFLRLSRNDPQGRDGCGSHGRKRPIPKLH